MHPSIYGGRVTKGQRKGEADGIEIAQIVLGRRRYDEPYKIYWQLFYHISSMQFQFKIRTINLGEFLIHLVDAQSHHGYVSAIVRRINWPVDQWTTDTVRSFI